MSAPPVPGISVEEYLAADRVAEVKSEYHDGEVFPVADASLQHARILVNVAWRVSERLESSPCQALGPTRVRVSPTKFVYPDLLVVCGEPELTDEHQDTLTNPKVIVEILSPSTAGDDSGEKFRLYRRLPSFEEYALIAQDEPRVEVFHRNPEGTWLLTTHEGLDATFPLDSLGITLPLAEIYDRVGF